MTLKKTAAISFLVLSLSGTILMAQSSTTNQAESISATESNTSPDHGGIRSAYQCSAHSTHNDWDIIYGDTSWNRHDAKDSAIHECEHQTGHECVAHECYRVRGYSPVQ